MTADERWRPVPGYENTYAVSDHGRVWTRRRRGTKGGIVGQWVDRQGYPRVTLSQDDQTVTRFVHRLVAAAFLGPCPPGLEVRHLNGDPSNPAATNLAYGTRRENEDDKRRHGTHHNVVKTHCPADHPYSGPNLYVEVRTGRRICRTCRKEQDRARYERKVMRAAGLAG